MALTTEQKTALKADIDASEFTGTPNTPDGNSLIAAAYNLPASPDFIVWRTNIDTHDIKSVIVWTEYRDTAVADKMTFELMVSNGALDGSDVNIRQGIADVFAGPQAATTRNNLTELAKRLATRGEAILATGTGSTASPGMMTFEGNLSYWDIADARNS